MYFGPQNQCLDPTHPTCSSHTQALAMFCDILPALASGCPPTWGLRTHSVPPDSFKASGIWPTMGSCTWKYALSPDFLKSGHSQSLDSGLYSLCLELTLIFYSPYYQIHTCPFYPSCLLAMISFKKKDPIEVSELATYGSFQEMSGASVDSQIVPDN